MDWFRRLFPRRNRARTGLVCYLRENGPIAYGTEVFGQDPRERVDAMLASTEISWYWKTSGRDPLSRDWTQLTRWSMAAMLADLAAEQDGLKPHVLVVGIDESGREGPEEVTDGRVASWIRAFSGAAQAPPLHAVVSRPGPGGDLFFVAQQPPEVVRNLLQAWGIDRDKAQRKAYARLHGTALEDIARSLTAR